MGYNYGSECKKFHAKWDRFSREYAAAGMSEVDIQTMRDFDWEELKRERIIAIHNQSLECAFTDSDAAGESNSPLLHSQLAHLSTLQPEICDWSRLDWIEDLDTPELAATIKGLSLADQELLSDLVMGGLRRTEIAAKLRVSRSAVTQRLNRIKSRLEKICIDG
jgi:DNA-directed RNA polymerase specialized sigma24 family protein